MGNSSSSEQQNLATLYNMNQSELQQLRIQLQKERDTNNRLQQELLTKLKRENEQIRQSVSQTQYRQVNDFINNVNSDYNKIDPYKILNLPKNFTEQQLKDSYKRLAIRFHPDRPNGSIHHFKIISDAYNELSEKLKLEQADKQYMELKQNSKDFIQRQRSTNMQHKKLSGNFDPIKFNKIFSENRFETAEDHGYKDWIEQNPLDDSGPKRMTGSFTNQNFNDHFNRNAKNDSQQVVEYKVPQPLYSNSNSNIQELGVDKIKDFSGNGYTDYKKAHSQQRLIDPTKITARQDFRDINHIKSDRSRVIPLNDQELQLLEEQKRNEEYNQKQRAYNLQKMDNEASKRYDSLHSRMLQNVYN